jgi:prepilin-type N-terminal cleavage/methylation domain-containing protein
MKIKKKSGFTLIELLVVIAIIAILAAILFPVFVRVKAAALKTQCSSNMKQCGIALQTYLSENDDALPYSNATPEIPNFSIDGGWATTLADNLKSKDITICPADSENTLSSYIWKNAIDIAAQALVNPCRKMSDFCSPSEQIFLYEENGYHDGGKVLSQLTQQNQIQMNVVFMDSHVKFVTLRGNDGEPQQYNYRIEYDSQTDQQPGECFMAPDDPRVYGDRL